MANVSTKAKFWASVLQMERDPLNLEWENGLAIGEKTQQVEIDAKLTSAILNRQKLLTKACTLKYWSHWQRQNPERFAATKIVDMQLQVVLLDVLSVTSCSSLLKLKSESGTFSDTSESCRKKPWRNKSGSISITLSS